MRFTRTGAAFRSSAVCARRRVLHDGATRVRPRRQSRRPQLLEGAAHECLPDALTPALRGHEEPADLSDVVLVARADLSESDDPVLVLGDEWEALTPQWDAGGRVERRERFRLENVSESGLVAADLDDGDRPRILGYCLTNADVHLSRPSTRDSASFRRRGSRLAARSERPSLHAAVSLRAR
jgi:hypothetical protein